MALTVCKELRAQRRFDATGPSLTGQHLQRSAGAAGGWGRSRLRGTRQVRRRERLCENGDRTPQGMSQSTAHAVERGRARQRHCKCKARAPLRHCKATTTTLPSYTTKTRQRHGTHTAKAPQGHHTHCKHVLPCSSKCTAWPCRTGAWRNHVKIGRAHV